MTSTNRMLGLVPLGFALGIMLQITAWLCRDNQTLDLLDWSELRLTMVTGAILWSLGRVMVWHRVSQEAISYGLLIAVTIAAVAFQTLLFGGTSLQGSQEAPLYYVVSLILTLTCYGFARAVAANRPAKA